MHLFLQGHPRIGKSTLLRKALEPFALSIAGFVTQRLGCDGEIIGYRALSVAGVMPPLEAEYDVNQTGIFLFKSKIDISVLERTILQAEQSTKTPKCKLILLDEVGGVELKSKVFKKALMRILGGEKPCIGVWKSTPNLSHTISMLKLSSEYYNPHDDFEPMIQSSGELLLQTKTKKTYNDILTCMSSGCLG